MYVASVVCFVWDTKPDFPTVQFITTSRERVVELELALAILEGKKKLAEFTQHVSLVEKLKKKTFKIFSRK